MEHSNEVWSPGSAPGRHAAARGLALGLAADETTARWRYHGRRSHEVFDIFAAAFGGRQRLHFVVGTWGYVCNGGTGCGVPAMRETLGMADGAGVSLAAKADLVAVTAYFGCDLGADGTRDSLVRPAGGAAPAAAGCDKRGCSARQAWAGAVSRQRQPRPHCRLPSSLDLVPS